MSLALSVAQILQIHESRDRANNAWTQYTEEKKHIRNYSDLIQEELSKLYDVKNHDYNEYLRKALLTINKDPLMSLPDIWGIRKIFKTEIDTRESGSTKISAIYTALGLSLPGINEAIPGHTQEKTAYILSIWEKENQRRKREEELWGLADTPAPKGHPKIINIDYLDNDFDNEGIDIFHGDELPWND